MDRVDIITWAVTIVICIAVIGGLVLWIRSEIAQNNLYERMEMACEQAGYHGVDIVGGEMYCIRSEYFPVQELP